MRLFARVLLVSWCWGCGSSGVDAQDPASSAAAAPSGSAPAARPAGSVVATPPPPPKPRKRARGGPMFVTEHDVTLKVQMEADARRKSFVSQAEPDPKGKPILVRRDDGCYVAGEGGPEDAACPAAYDDPAWDNCPDGVLYAVDASECYCEAAAAPKAGARPIWRNSCPKKLRGR